MIARIQAAVTLSALLIAVTCAILGWQSANWVWGVPLLAMPVGYVSCVGVELYLQRSVSCRRGEPSPGYAGFPRAAWNEALAGIRVFGWSQPFNSNAYPDRLSNPRGTRGVVLLHGFYCNRGVWNSWMRALGDMDVPFAAVNLEPPFKSIDNYTMTIDEAIHDMTEATGRTPIVIGHSMGGIAARAWLNASRGAARVHRIITIGSPHQGTLLSRFAWSPNARQMSFGSGWLAALAGAETSDSARKFICFYSVHDNVVVPASSACLPGADNRLVSRRAHLDLLGAPEILAELIRLVESTDN